MRRFIVGILVLVFSVWLGLKIAADPGVAMFSYRDWMVETPLWFAAVVQIAWIVVIYLLVRFFDGIDMSVYRFKNWLRWRRKNKAYGKTNRGLLELIEGRWRNAENYLLEGVSQSDAPLVNYLAAAKAANEQRAFDKRDKYLKKAYDLAPHAEVAIGLTQAQLQFSQNQLEQALASLANVRRYAPKNVMALQLLQQIYVRLHDWPALLTLLPMLRKQKVLSAEQLDQLEKSVYEQMILINGNKDYTALNAVWRSIPKKLQNDPTLVECYTKQMLHDSQYSLELESLISKSLDKVWNKNLVKLYGLLITAKPKKQLDQAEKWLSLHPQDAVLLLTLGRLCMRCPLWGKAKDYFEESLRLEANAETYNEYAKLLEQLGQEAQAIKSYRQGLAALSVD
jgi:HemY protein